MALVVVGLQWAMASDAGATGKAVQGVVNLNTAPPATLELLPGVGPAKVQSILDYRRKHPFRTTDELVRIKGIGHKMVKRLRPHLAISGPTTAQAARGGAGEPAPPPAPTPPPDRRSTVCPPQAPPRPTGRTARTPTARNLIATANHCLAKP